MIKIINLNKKDANKWIFKKINLVIPANKLVFIVGAAGIGKSTLINLIAGFTKKDEGEILFFKDGKEEKNPLIDVVFQDFNLIEQLSVKNNILIGNSLIQKEFNQNLLEKSANFLNIQSSKLKQKTNDLSDGEKQRVAILRAFSRNSDFILLDEPTGNLDRENEIAVFESLKKLSKNKTILVASRNLDLAKKYADQIIHLKNNSVEIEICEKNEEIKSEIFAFETKIEQKPVSFSTKFKTGLLLVFADFRLKMVSTILLIFAFFMAIFGIVSYFSLTSRVEAVSKSKIFQHQLDSISIWKGPGNRFEVEEIKKIEEKGGNIAKILPFYVTYMSFSYNGQQSSHGYVDFVDESEFFSKRFKPGTKDFQGRFIRNENEIIISSKLIKELKIENPIGKKIKFIDDINGRMDQELLIVGINNASNQWNQQLSFVHFNLPKSTFIKNKQKNLNKENDQIFSFLESGNSKKAQISKIYYENQAEIKKFKLLEGNFPKNSDEIVISSDLQNFINSNKNSIINNIVYSWSGNTGQNFDFKIVGVYDSKNQNGELNDKIEKNSIPKTEVIFHHTIIEKSKTFKPIFLKIFFNYKNLNENIKNFWNSFPEYKKLEPVKTVRDNFEGPIKVLSWFFIAISVFLSIIFLIAMIFYSINLASSKRKIIRLLKNLKAKPWQIFLYHWMTCVFISVLAFVFGFVVLMPLIPEIYHWISGQNVVLPSYSIVSFYVFVVWLAGFFIFSIFSLLTLRTNYKRSIA
ncbi:ATP-binding cassette domain-containing protein [Mesomycoplasma hyopneumoniae]|uniref:ATP-binding cassette domain-containing protein n=1 Tax=Mesomycoplasma hyopneumoniae TaxID=2099 RepID=UPI0015C67A63|nr:ATP-binding cassette domain-containing protein [Mesomycoplasma hyopneumoniae]QLG43162.1 ATP-binding cassette domain-containing protein [Mesomycoplasma hyopneumoniae]